MDHLSKYLTKPHALSEEKITERGQLICWFRDELNKVNRMEGYRPVSAGEVAKRLQGIKTHDLGRDLYFVKGKVDEALESGFPVGAAFYGTIKKLKDDNRQELRAIW